MNFIAENHLSIILMGYAVYLVINRFKVKHTDDIVDRYVGLLRHMKHNTRSKR